jgi:photosystem II stability/assembly factor-like uncharacterized protein
MKRNLLLLVLVNLIFLADVDAQWVRVKATTGSVSCFAVGQTPTGAPVLYAGSSGEVLITTDNGTTWSSSTAGLGSSTIKWIAVNGNTLVAANGTKIVTSTNAAQSWSDASSGLPSRQVLSTAIVSGSGTSMNLLAGVPDNSVGGIFRSTNFGLTWVTSNTGLTNKLVQCITSIGTMFFAGTSGGGVFRSSDGGVSWTAANNGLVYDVVFSLATSGATLFAGTMSRVYASADNGATWTATIDGMNIGTLVRCLSAGPKAGGGTNLFAGTQGGGIYYSADLGKNWTLVHTGYTDTDIYGLAIVGTNLYAAGTTGIWKRPIAEFLAATAVSSTDMPVSFEVSPNYPNPFNPGTKIQYSLPRLGVVTAAIYDIHGRLVRSLVHAMQDGGTHMLAWDGRSEQNLPAASGTYYCRIEYDNRVQVRALLLLK